MSSSYLLALAAFARYEPIVYPGRPCLEAQYFDVSALACLTCPPLQEPDPIGTSCICIEGHVLAGSACVLCNASASAPTRDRTVCLPCATTCSGGNATCLDATLGLVGSECACPPGRVVVERDGHGGLLEAKRCQTCPDGAYAASATECRACPRPHMVAATTTGCVCATGFRQFTHPNGWWGNELTCIDDAAYAQLESFYSASSLQMRYVDLPVSQGSSFLVDESKIMQQLLLPSAAECLLAVQASTQAPRAQSLLVGNQACQAMGNMCVLRDYDTSAQINALAAATQHTCALEALDHLRTTPSA